MEENKEKGRRNSKNATQIPKQNTPSPKVKLERGYTFQIAVHQKQSILDSRAKTLFLRCENVLLSKEEYLTKHL